MLNLSPFTVADLLDKDAGRPSLLLLGGVVAAAILWSQLGLRRRSWTPQLGEAEPGIPVVVPAAGVLEPEIG